MLGDKSNLPLAYQQSTLNTEELGPFLRLCLMDQSFPAFVEQVEQELKKLIEEWLGWPPFIGAAEDNCYKFCLFGCLLTQYIDVFSLF